MSEYVKHEIMLPKELSEKIPKGSVLRWRMIVDEEAIVGKDIVECIGGHHAIVIEPAWTAPDWMPRGWWLAMDGTGVWYMFGSKPVLVEKTWMPSSNLMVKLDIVNWTQPVVDGAEDSLRQI